MQHLPLPSMLFPSRNFSLLKDQDPHPPVAWAGWEASLFVSIYVCNQASAKPQAWGAVSGQTEEAFSHPQASLRLPTPNGPQNALCAEPATFLRTFLSAVSSRRKGAAAHVNHALGMLVPRGQHPQARFYRSCLFKKRGGYPGTPHGAVERNDFQCFRCTDVFEVCKHWLLLFNQFDLQEIK